MTMSSKRKAHLRIYCLHSDIFFSSNRPTGFIAGTSHVTIADITAVATFTTVQATGLVDTSPFTALPAWVDKVRAVVPGFQKINDAGIEEFKKVIKKVLDDVQGK